jgi:predicted amidohydrolase
MLKVALAQVKSSRDKSVNLKLAVEHIAAAKNSGADLIAFPEFLMAFSPAEESAAALAGRAESLDGPFVGALQQAAERFGIAVLATLYETCPLPDRVYDTAIWIDAAGRLAAAYRKLHLYDAFGFKESDKFHPGREIAPTARCAGVPCGIMICYDLRFPEMARMLALFCAEVLFAPSGWLQGDMKLDHWQTMVKARALENGCYVVAPGQTGNIYIGHSLAVDPYGRILLDLGEREAIEIVAIDVKLVAEAREKLPLLANRRTEVYRELLLKS